MQGHLEKALMTVDDLTNSEKNLMSLMVGTSELALASMFRGAEQIAGKAYSYLKVCSSRS